jgi:hypothetical protein
MLKRTPIGAKFSKQLVKANDQACFSALEHFEFSKILRRLEATQADDFTTEIFGDNPYAARMYRRGCELRNFGTTAADVGLQMAIIASYEYADAFSSELQSFRRVHHPSPADSIKAEADEDTLREKIVAWSGEEQPRGYFDTLGYLRHRRNHFAHGNEELEAAFSKFINQRGHQLNTFWKNDQTKIFGYDFRIRELNSVTAEHAFGLINMLRVSVSCIDEMFANTLSYEELFLSETKSILATPQHRGLPIRKVASKARTRLQISYGHRCDSEAALELAQRAAIELAKNAI